MFMEAGALPVTGCLATNAYCTATCSCYDGYAGSDCGSTTADYEATESIRETLCVALGEGGESHRTHGPMCPIIAVIT